mmetsp:Transcript_30077/g.73733  ORF Transcript_30077/g.73733 Transcript_30077/m.73733 type:complete len:302 (+) Transcript_30077:7045-7950(+)
MLSAPTLSSSTPMSRVRQRQRLLSPMTPPESMPSSMSPLSHQSLPSSAHFRCPPWCVRARRLRSLSQTPSASPCPQRQSATIPTSCLRRSTSCVPSGRRSVHSSTAPSFPARQSLARSSSHQQSSVTSSISSTSTLCRLAPTAPWCSRRPLVVLPNRLSASGILWLLGAPTLARLLTQRYSPARAACLHQRRGGGTGSRLSLRFRLSPIRLATSLHASLCRAMRVESMSASSTATAQPQSPRVRLRLRGAPKCRSRTLLPKCRASNFPSTTKHSPSQTASLTSPRVRMSRSQCRTNRLLRA